MNEAQFKILNDKLDFLSKVLVMNLIKDMEFKDQAIQLSNFGYKEIEIVKMLNSTRDRVHNILRNK